MEPAERVQRRSRPSSRGADCGRSPATGSSVGRTRATLSACSARIGVGRTPLATRVSSLTSGANTSCASGHNRRTASANRSEASPLLSASRRSHASAWSRWYVSSLRIFRPAAPAARSPMWPVRRDGPRRRSRTGSGGRRWPPNRPRSWSSSERGGTPQAPGRRRSHRHPRLPVSSRQQLVQRPGVADLVLRDRAGRDVLLEHRRDAGPLGVPEADHELVVGQRQQQLGQRIAGGGGRARGRAVVTRPASAAGSAPSRPRACA